MLYAIFFRNKPRLAASHLELYIDVWHHVWKEDLIGQTYFCWNPSKYFCSAGEWKFSQEPPKICKFPRELFRFKSLLSVKLILFTRPLHETWDSPSGGLAMSHTPEEKLQHALTSNSHHALSWEKIKWLWAFGAVLLILRWVNYSVLKQSGCVDHKEHTIVWSSSPSGVQRNAAHFSTTGLTQKWPWRLWCSRPVITSELPPPNHH